MKINILISYPGAKKSASIWAREDTDFFGSPWETERCTVAFAADEIKRYLQKAIDGLKVMIAENAENDSEGVIELAVIPGTPEDAYTLTPIKTSPSGEIPFVRIQGNSRRGLLYGAYEFLKLQGIRWYFPERLDGTRGEYIPSLPSIVWPEKEMRFTPAMRRCRGIDLNESQCVFTFPETLLWMARNRLNMAIASPPTNALAHKLGFISKGGGHIFTEPMRPDTSFYDGKTLWETHREWYGMDAKSPEDALSVQLCCAHEDLFDYLGDWLINQLNTRWKDHDSIDAAGFDSWGRSCGCDFCRRLGNASDQQFYFITRLQIRFDNATRSGHLHCKVRLNFCSYEGTLTLDPPEGKIPLYFVENGGWIVYYPINRCYAHDMEDTDCQMNERYLASMAAWKKKREESGCRDGQASLVIGEYYNVSKFEDLPLVFTARMKHDIPWYQQNGFDGITFMHPPEMHWGVRALNQNLYATLSWDPETDCEALIAEYYDKLYGIHAESARKIHETFEDAWKNVAAWRSWDANTILSRLLVWDGGVPLTALPESANHFPQGQASEGYDAAGKLANAVKIADESIRREQRRLASIPPTNTRAACNPSELSMLTPVEGFLPRLRELARQAACAHDVMLLQALTADYYTQAYCIGNLHNTVCDELMSQIGAVEYRMERTLWPLAGHEESGFEVSDLLHRSQLASVLCRMRRAREV